MKITLTFPDKLNDGSAYVWGTKALRFDGEQVMLLYKPTQNVLNLTNLLLFSPHKRNRTTFKDEIRKIMESK